MGTVGQVKEAALIEAQVDCEGRDIPKVDVMAVELMETGVITGKWQKFCGVQFMVSGQGK